MNIDWDECTKFLPPKWKELVMGLSRPEARMDLIVSMYIRMMEKECG